MSAESTVPVVAARAASGDAVARDERSAERRRLPFAYVHDCIFRFATDRSIWGADVDRVFLETDYHCLEQISVDQLSSALRVIIQNGLSRTPKAGSVFLRLAHREGRTRISVQHETWTASDVRATEAALASPAVRQFVADVEGRIESIHGNGQAMISLNFPTRSGHDHLQEQVLAA